VSEGDKNVNSVTSGVTAIFTVLTGSHFHKFQARLSQKNPEESWLFKQLPSSL